MTDPYDSEYWEDMDRLCEDLSDAPLTYLGDPLRQPFYSPFDTREEDHGLR